MKRNQKNYKLCELCDIEATCLCLKCYIYYCDACFKYIHDKKKGNDHKKEKIDYFAPIDTKCPEHEGIRINLFCVDEMGKNIICLFLFLF